MMSFPSGHNHSPTRTLITFGASLCIMLFGLMIVLMGLYGNVYNVKSGKVVDYHFHRNDNVWSVKIRNERGHTTWVIVDQNPAIYHPLNSYYP